MAQQSSVLGRALATWVSHRVGLGDRGQVVRRQRLARRALRPLVARPPPALMGMDAGGRAHSWARRWGAPGQAGRLIAPPFGNASGTSPKHAAREADALGEAVTRPTRRCGPISRAEPPARHALPRGRERLIQARTAWVHASRGLPSASGSVLPPGMRPLRPSVVRPLGAEQATLPPLRAAACWPL